MVNKLYATYIRTDIKIYFGDKFDVYAFLELCRMIAKIMEKNEKFSR